MLSKKVLDFVVLWKSDNLAVEERPCAPLPLCLDSLYVVRVPCFTEHVWFPRERNLEKKKKKQPRGSADAFCFLSDLIPADTYVKLSLVGSRCCLQCQL